MTIKIDASWAGFNIGQAVSKFLDTLLAGYTFTKKEEETIREAVMVALDAETNLNLNASFIPESPITGQWKKAVTNFVDDVGWLYELAEQSPPEGNQKQ